MTDSQPASSDTPIRFGRYTIHDLLGIGGMAEVYRASVRGPEGFEKPVVVKRVKPQYCADPNFVQMFIDEAKIGASMDHPHIVSVFDFGEEDGHNYLAMEFVDGLDLQVTHVRYHEQHQKPLPWPESLLIARDLLRGLDYAHHQTDREGRALQIIHRDINLVNVMLRRDGTVKILDFGCAKAANTIRATQTIAGVIKGKLGYMSPEQTRDQPLDPRTDVFSASIVLHELLTGRRLFYGDDALAVIKAVRQKAIPDPRRYAPEVPDEVVEVVMRGLAREPEKRYPSAGAMADALESIIYEHRIGATRLRDLMAGLMIEESKPTIVDPSLQRKMTLAAWRESRSEYVSLMRERVTGVVTAAGVTSSPETPSVEETLITTNPRWLLADIEAVADTVAAPGVGLGDQATEILHTPETPAIPEAQALHDQETVLLTSEDLPPAPATAAPEPVLLDQPKPPVARPRWPFVLLGVALLAGMALLLWAFLH